MVDSAGREFRGEAEWRALMADFERWDGSRTSFCEARGVSRKTFQGWRRRFGLPEATGGTFGFAATDGSVSMMGAFSACHCAPAADGDPDDPVASRR